MTLPFTRQQVSTTESAINYVKTASKTDFDVFADWFVKGSSIWTLPAGHKDAVLAAIETRKTSND